MRRFQNILVEVDTRSNEHPALHWAVRLAEHNQAKLKIVDVLPEMSWLAKLAIPDSEGAQEAIAEQKSRRLIAIGESIRDKGIEITTQLLSGKTSFAIMHEVLKSRHDLVVRGTKGSRSGRIGFFGTTSVRLLRKCPCCVWLVGTSKPPRFGRVLSAIDLDPNNVNCEIMNRSIMDLAKSVADYEQGQLHVIHAWELFGEQILRSRHNTGEIAAAKSNAEARVTSMLDHFLSEYKLSHESERVHLQSDSLGPGHAIAEVAKREKIDLVVMGTIARTGLQGALMGNTAEQLIDRLECSVLAIKPDDYVSPVLLPDE